MSNLPTPAILRALSSRATRIPLQSAARPLAPRLSQTTRTGVTTGPRRARLLSRVRVPLVPSPEVPPRWLLSQAQIRLRHLAASPSTRRPPVLHTSPARTPPPLPAIPADRTAPAQPSPCESHGQLPQWPLQSNRLICLPQSQF